MENVQKNKSINFAKMRITCILFTIVIFFILSYKTHPIDNDMWWMMATGREILKNHAVPKTNPFSIIPNIKMIVQQPLLAITNYTLYTKLGEFGLFLFATFFYITNIILLYIYTKENENFKLNNHEYLLSEILILLSGIFLFSTYLNTRSTQITITILLIEQIVIKKFKKSGNKKLLWIIPILTLIEANIHSSFFWFLYIMALPHIVPGLWEKKKLILQQKQISFPIIKALLVGFFTGLCNPNGIYNLCYIFTANLNAEIFQNIKELQKPSINSIYGIAIIILFLFLIFYFIKNCKRKTIKADVIYTCLGVLLLSSYCIRNTWFLVFGYAILFPEFKTKPVFIKTYSDTRNKIAYYLNIFLFCNLWILMYHSMPEDNQTNTYPYIAETLTQEKEEGPVTLFTTFANGGYFEWEGFRVFIDARPELYSEYYHPEKRNICEDYLDIIHRRNNYKLLLEEYDFTHFVIEKDSDLSNSFQKENNKYILLKEENNNELWKKVKK